MLLLLLLLLLRNERVYSFVRSWVVSNVGSNRIESNAMITLLLANYFAAC
jgi:hypothetical protein